MKASERINKIVDHFGDSLTIIASKSGIKPQRLYDISSGKTKSFSEEVGKGIISLYPQLNPSWLFYGEGEMLNPEQSNSNAEEILPAGWMNVPVVPVTAQAGYTNGYGDAEYIDSLDRMPFPVDRQYKGRYICFEVRGDSMDDGTSQSILDGDFVLAREIGRTLWEDYKLHFNKWLAFVIVTREEGIMIKQIIDHDVTNHIITLHSLNPLFHDYQVSLENVLEIYNVVQVTRKHR